VNINEREEITLEEESSATELIVRLSVWEVKANLLKELSSPYPLL
jgi:hypothetical protein